MMAIAGRVQWHRIWLPLDLVHGTTQAEFDRIVVRIIIVAVELEPRSQTKRSPTARCTVRVASRNARNAAGSLDVILAA